MSTIKPLKRCDHVGCLKLVPYDQRYCSKHKKEYLAKQKRILTKKGKSSRSKWNYQTRKTIYAKYNKFYQSKRWRRLSRLFRENHPLCAECLKRGRYVRARAVDHIIPIRVDWSKRFDEENLQSLCIQCHNKKSLDDIKKYNIKPLEKKQSPPAVLTG